MKIRTVLPLAIVGIGLSSQLQGSSQQQKIDLVWQIVNDKYYDTSFNGVNWQQVRSQSSIPKQAGLQDDRAAIRSMLQQLQDPAVRLLTQEQVAPFLQELSEKPHVGIGLVELLSVDTNSKTRKITVVAPIPASPAARAGILPGDVIASVDNVPTQGMNLADTMMRLRGQPNTKVKLKIARSNRILNITLDRTIIQSPFVRSSLKLVNNQKIGYLAFDRFTSTVAAEMRSAVRDLTKQGANAFVLDLRNNPGGDVAAGKNIAGIFLGEKPFATILGRDRRTTQLMATGDKLTDEPLTVLVNYGTASMGEILASGLQENRRAKLIRTKTFGKSLLQTFENLPDRSVVTIPIGKIQTLTGREILNTGVTPDRLIELNSSPMIVPASLQDLQFQQAIQITNRK
jgi:carboxyl-terminal processing protease